jgi:shikimate dehydrogenase
VGHSTDIAAVRKVWERRRLPLDPVLLLGSGGAAAAALVALEGRQVVVAARRRDAAEGLVRAVGARAEVCGWEEARLRAVVVNATPLGMRGEELPEWMLQQATGVFDMAYGWGETPVLALARRRGLPAADGIDMLVAQAEESFRLWTGVSPPEGVMEEAARNPSRALSGAPTQPTRTEAQE